MKNMSEENHNSVKLINSFRKNFKMDVDFCLYCVVRYSNEKILYKIVKLSKKKAYYILKSEYIFVEPFLSSIDINQINFVSTEKKLALNFIN